MKKQIDLLLNGDWDVLCVLDACRFDYFAQMYWKYFQGRLEKCWSGGSNTHEWCMNYINGNEDFWEDVIVISANPHINSSVPLPHAKFDPTDKFKKVYDVWIDKYANDIGSTDPETVCERYEELKPFPENQKVVLWFIVPHSPYLLFEDVEFEGINPEKLGRKKLAPLWKKAIRKFALGLENWVDVMPIWAMKLSWKLWDKLFGLAGIRRVLAEKGEDKLEEAYKYNIKRALKSIRDTDFGDKDVVITADHGEIITWKERRECGFLDHPAGKEHTSLREVPWFEVEAKDES